MATPGGVAGAVTALAERRRLEELARLGYIDPQLTDGVPRGASYTGDLPLLMPPQAPPLPRGEPARPGGYLPPVPDDVPRMRPPTALEQLRQTIVDYVQAQEAGEAPMHPLRRPATPGGLPGTGELTRPTIGPASDQQRMSQAIADVWRLRFAGVPDRGIGNVRPTKEWQQIYDAMLRNSAPVAKGNRVIYGKDDPRVILW